MICVLNFTSYYFHSDAALMIIYWILLYSSWYKVVVSGVLQLFKDTLIDECLCEKKNPSNCNLTEVFLRHVSLIAMLVCVDC